MNDRILQTPKIDLSFPRGPCVVMASGVWDLLHRGHLNLLFRAAQLGNMLLVGVVSDEGTEAYKGQKPEWSLQRRLTAVRSLSFVTYAEQQDGTDPTPLLERWRPNLFVHGDDWLRLREGHETLERLGIEYRALPYTQGISTTELRKTEPAKANGGDFGSIHDYPPLLFGGP